MTLTAELGIESFSDTAGGDTSWLSHENHAGYPVEEVRAGLWHS